MKLGFFLWVVFLCFALCENALAGTLKHDSLLSSCESTTPVTADIYIGWPHTITCDAFLFDAEDSLYSFYYEYTGFNFDSEVKCLIFDDEKRLLFEETTTFDDLATDQASGLHLPEINQEKNNYEIVVQLIDFDRCLRKQVHLNLTVYEPETCEQFLARQNTLLIPTSLGVRRRVTCESPYPPEMPRIYATSSSPNTTFRWQRNCTKTLPNELTVDSNNVISFPSVKYDDAGIYVCSVTHNGMTRYVRAFAMCVQKQLPLPFQAHLTCPNTTYYAAKGEDVSITCKVNFGEGYVSRSNYEIYGGKVNSERPCLQVSKFGSISNDVSCSYMETGETCFLRVLSMAERVSTPYIIPVQLTIRNVQSSDFGAYSFQLLTIALDRFDVNVNLVETR